jgi:hypothetical protein
MLLKKNTRLILLLCLIFHGGLVSCASPSVDIHNDFIDNSRINSVQQNLEKIDISKNIYLETKNNFCAQNPLDCNEHGHVVGIRLDSFYQHFFKQLDIAFFHLGFDAIELEYCSNFLKNCYINYRNKKLSDIKNSQAKTIVSSEFIISDVFPTDDFWHESLKPQSSSRGLIIARRLKDNEFASFCNTNVKSGKKLHTINANINSLNLTFEEFKNLNDLRDVGVEYRIYIDQPFMFKPENIGNYAADCYIYNLHKRHNNPLEAFNSNSFFYRESSVSVLTGKPFTLKSNQN